MTGLPRRCESICSKVFGVWRIFLKIPCGLPAALNRKAAKMPVAFRLPCHAAFSRRRAVRPFPTPQMRKHLLESFWGAGDFFKNPLRPSRGLPVALAFPFPTKKRHGMLRAAAVQKITSANRGFCSRRRTPSSPCRTRQCPNPSADGPPACRTFRPSVSPHGSRPWRIPAPDRRS